MSHRTHLSHAAIRSMLAARADRATRYPFDPAAIVAAAGPRAHRFTPSSRSIGRVSIAAGGLAAVIAVAVLVAGSTLEKPGASKAPIGSEPAISTSGPASATPSASAMPAEDIRIFTAGEAGDLIRSQSAVRAGSLLIVNGSLIAGETVVTHCGSRPCGSTLLADAGGGFVVKPLGDFGPGPWSASGPGHLSGTFVLRLSAAVDNHLRIVDFIGVLTTPPGGGPTWFVQDLIDGAAHVEGAYAAVDGWLVRDPVHPCGSDPRNPVVSYGCPTDDWLSEDRFQPLQADGSSIGPPAAIDLSSGSYDRWAADPVPAGPGGQGVEPRHAIYLLWLVSDGCGPNADCLAPPPRWRIVGRFDPLPHPVEPSPSELRSATPLVEGAVPPPAGDAWTVAELLDRPIGRGTFVVRGWLVATPPLKCVGAGPYSCSEVDWITDAPFQPWVADGQDGSTRSPEVGIRVQDGAYAAFAPSPAFLPATGAGRTPRFGDYLVRESIGSTCPDGSGTTPQPVCLGGPMVQWEVIARLP